LGIAPRSRRAAFRFKGVAATTNPITVRGRTIQFTEQNLREAAKQAEGMPVGCDHRGPPIGEVERAWYDDGKLHVEGVVWEPISEEECRVVEALRSGKINGLSLEYWYEPPKAPPPEVVLHGVITGKFKRSGEYFFKFAIPKEEIEKKLGSLDALSEFRPKRVFLHDGSETSKKRVEEECLG